MKDKTSFSNSRMQISKDLQDYINSLVEEVDIKNKDFDPQKKYLERYAKAENIDFNALIDSLEQLLYKLKRYRTSNENHLRQEIREHAEQGYVSPDLLDRLLSNKTRVTPLPAPPPIETVVFEKNKNFFIRGIVFLIIGFF